MISIYDARETLKAAKSMTGNKDFDKILELMNAQHEVVALAKVVTMSFPERDGYRDKLEVLIKQRLGKTKELMELSRKL